MDYKELLEDRDFKSPEEICQWMDKAAIAITNLLARTEAAEARAERLERERDAAAQFIAMNCMYTELKNHGYYCAIDDKPCDKCIGVWRVKRRNKRENSKKTLHCYAKRPNRSLVWIIKTF